MWPYNPRRPQPSECTGFAVPASISRSIRPRNDQREGRSLYFRDARASVTSAQPTCPREADRKRAWDPIEGTWSCEDEVGNSEQKATVTGTLRDMGANLSTDGIHPDGRPKDGTKGPRTGGKRGFSDQHLGAMDERSMKRIKQPIPAWPRVHASHTPSTTTARVIDLTDEEEPQHRSGSISAWSTQPEVKRESAIFEPSQPSTLRHDSNADLADMATSSAQDTSQSRPASTDSSLSANKSDVFRLKARIQRLSDFQLERQQKRTSIPAATGKIAKPTPSSTSAIQTTRKRHVNPFVEDDSSSDDPSADDPSTDVPGADDPNVDELSGPDASGPVTMQPDTGGSQVGIDIDAALLDLQRSQEVPTYDSLDLPDFEWNFALEDIAPENPARPTTIDFDPFENAAQSTAIELGPFSESVSRSIQTTKDEEQCKPPITLPQSKGCVDPSPEQNLSFDTTLPDGHKSQPLAASLRDEAHVTATSVEKNAHAGAARNVVGRATSSGFSFSTPGLERTKSQWPHGDTIHIKEQPSNPAVSQQEVGGAPTSLRAIYDSKIRSQEQSSPQDNSAKLMHPAGVANTDKAEYIIRDAARRGAFVERTVTKLNNMFNLEPFRGYTREIVSDMTVRLIGSQPYSRERQDRPRGVKNGQSPKGQIGIKVGKKKKANESVTFDIEDLERPTVGGKRVPKQWYVDYTAALREYDESACSSEDEESGTATEPSYDYEDASPRPVNIYKLLIYKRPLDESDHDLTIKSVREEDATHGQEEQIAEYTDLVTANQAAFTVLENVMCPGSEVSSYLDDGTGVESQKDCNTVVILGETWLWRARVERVVSLDPRHCRPAHRSIRYPSHIYVVEEEIKVSYDEDEGCFGGSELTDQTKTQELEGALSDHATQMSHAQNFDDNTKDLFGDDALEVVLKDNQEPASPKAPPSYRDATAQRQIRGWLESKRVVDEVVYNSLEEANSVAAKVILANLIHLHTSRLANLDRVSMERARLTGMVRELQACCNRDAECMSGAVSFMGDRPGESRTHCITVVKRLMRGARN